jgi:YgiT-type zinc finger domain-containing protein
MSRNKQIARAVVHDYATTTRPCHDCGAMMNGSRQSYHYEECGLSSVTLINVLVYKCNGCGLHVPELPSISLLHMFISIDILTKETLLAGEEIRFLRRMAGLKQTTLAEIMGVDSTRVSKWENEAPPIGKESDRLLRTLCLLGMTLQFAKSENTAEMRSLATANVIREIDVQKLLSKIREANEGPKQVKVKNDPAIGQGWYLPGLTRPSTPRELTH